MSRKYFVVCAVSEVVRERPHGFFVWANDPVEAVMAECPVCGSEGLVATECMDVKPWHYRKKFGTKKGSSKYRVRKCH